MKPNITDVTFTNGPDLLPLNPSVFIAVYPRLSLNPFYKAILSYQPSVKVAGATTLFSLSLPLLSAAVTFRERPSEQTLSRPFIYPRTQDVGGKSVKWTCFTCLSTREHDRKQVFSSSLWVNTSIVPCWWYLHAFISHKEHNTKVQKGSHQYHSGQPHAYDCLREMKRERSSVERGCTLQLPPS